MLEVFENGGIWSESGQIRGLDKVAYGADCSPSGVLEQRFEMVC